MAKEGGCGCRPATDHYGKTYDNLNRMTSSPKLFGSGSTSWAYTNDILGNRTWRNNVYSGTGATRYDWDIVNRMLLCANATSGSTYSYRADGQRIEKVDGVTLSWTGNRESGHYDTNYATSRPTYRYFYDGQMGIEDDYNPSGTVTKVNRYGLGARGIDRIEAWDGTNTTYGYPLYDGHGNMRGTLGRSGSSYSTGNWRTYDVWGGIRSGNGTGDPKQRYCANLGHVQDDESGLIYMRARYHDPLTGRFLSQDPAMHGWNWFSYCSNEPVSRVDESGRVDWVLGFVAGMGMVINGLGMLFLMAAVVQIGNAKSAHDMHLAYTALALAAALTTLAIVMVNPESFSHEAAQYLKKELLFHGMYYMTLYGMMLGAKMGMYTAASIAVVATFVYEVLCFSYLIAIEVEAFISD